MGATDGCGWKPKGEVKIFMSACPCLYVCEPKRMLQTSPKTCIPYTSNLRCVCVFVQASDVAFVYLTILHKLWADTKGQRGKK